MEKLHAAGARALELEHRLLLVVAGGNDAFVALGVIDPRLPGGHPAALYPLYGAVDVEHLEQQFERRAAQVDAGFERRGGQGGTGLGECIQHRFGLVLARHRRGCEVLPDVFVFDAGQQQHVGVLGGAAGTANLLVVGNGGGGRSEVQNEAEVRFVEAHAEGARGDECLDLVAFEHALGFFPFGGVGLAGVRAHLVAGFSQQSGGVFGRRDGQRVDDAAAGQLGEVAEQPRQPGPRVRQPQHAEAQRGAGQRAANGHNLGRAAGHARRHPTDLLRDIGHDPAVGRCGRGQHRHPRRHLRDEIAQSAVVRPKVVAPVGDAVRLVDHEQPDPADERGQLLVAKARVVEAFGAHEQHVDLVGLQRPHHVGPLMRVCGVD